MDTNEFKALLEKVRQETANASFGEKLETSISENEVTEIDFTGIYQTTTEEDIIQAIEMANEILLDAEIQEDEEIVEKEWEPIPEEEINARKILGVAREVTLNEKQQLFLNTVLERKDCILIGAAGTGKTTSMRQVTRELIASETLPKLSRGTKWLSSQAPGAAILSYTRKAVNNIRHAVVDELKGHTLTIHKLLEFAPVYYEVIDPKTGLPKNTMKFEPQRNAANPLPGDLQFLAFEESSMIGVDLYKLLQDAMPHAHQEVFLGDIQQLPPIFSLAILGFKMLELPVVELTEVYRQALNSPIISLAWDILRGDPQKFHPRTSKFLNAAGQEKIKVDSFDKYSVANEDGEVVISCWQNKITPETALKACAGQFNMWWQNGYYNPADDVILLPFNVSFGTEELNKSILQFLGEAREADVYEIIAGFNKHYYAVGDRVLYDKEDGVITSIRRNGNYMGQQFKQHSKHLDRWGMYHSRLTKADTAAKEAEDKEFSLKALDAFMNSTSVEDRVHAASHIVTIRMTYGEQEEVVLESAMQLNNLSGGHALTVHKFQGSECDRVFFLMHQSHATMNQRELLYTAVTRAKKFLYVVCEPDTFFKGLQSQKVKGNTIAEKAEWFKGKAAENAEKRKAELAVLEELQKNRKQLPSVTHNITQISGQPAIRIEDLPSLDTKAEAAIALKAIWADAQDKFGSIGECPTLAFNIRSKKVVGQANFRTGTIKLNPVWLAVAETDDEVAETMMYGTIVHEVCHHVAARKYNDRKHGPYWRLCMKKMLGRDVIGNDPATGLPPWLTTKNEIVMAVLARTSDTVTETSDDEEGEIS